MFEKTKINEKEGGVGLFTKIMFLINTHAARALSHVQHCIPFW